MDQEVRFGGLGEGSGTPRGLTLPKAWDLQCSVTGHLWVCLLARGRSSTPTEGIPKVVLIAPSDLTRALARGFTQVDNFSAPQLLVHDGRTGHCLTMEGHDPTTRAFLYWDPWGNRSLLCREFNDAGVDAQPAQ